MTAPASQKPSSGQKVLVGFLAVIAGGALFVLVALIATIGASSFGPARPVDPAIGGLAVGKAAPPIAAMGWVNGEPEDLTGRVTVVDGWFVGCPFCWKEAPDIAALHRKYAGQGVAFVGLSTDPPQAVDEVKDFVEKNGLAYPNGYGALETLAGFEARYFPAVWVVGKDGKVVWNRAMADQESLEDAIRRALSAS